MIKEEFEDTRGTIRIWKSKDRHYNGHKKKDKKTNNDLQNITHKTKDQATRTPLKTRIVRSTVFSGYSFFLHQ